MATISSTLKMQDQASGIFNKVANSMNSILDKADLISEKTSNMDGGFRKVSPALQQAVNKYQDLMAEQDSVNAKIDLLTQKEQLLKNKIAEQKGAYNQNKAAILSTQSALFNVQKEKDKLIKKSDNLTEEIYEQATAVDKVARKSKGIKFGGDDEGGFSKMQSHIITINQGLQLLTTTARGLKKVLDYSDELTLTKARLDLINDGTQTTVELQNKLYQAAQRSRGSYEDMSQSVAKLGLLAGDAFKSNDEMVAFSEMLNKSFKVSGAGVQEISSATYQLTQAMASGKLQGDEFRSIMENAPMLADAIAKYMGKSKGELKELSSEGVITSDIIKNALFSASDEINEKFEQMPKTFGDAMNNIKNTTSRYLQPVADKITEFLNSEKFQVILNQMLSAIRTFAAIAYKSFQLVGNAITFFKNNMWLTIPIIMLVATVLAINLVSSIWATTVKLYGMAAAWLAAHWQIMLFIGIVGLVIGIMVSMGATLQQIIAVIGILIAVLLIWKIVQWLVNAALYACPIVWIIAIVIALILVIIFLISCLFSLGDSTNSVFGYMCAIIMSAVAFVYNLFASLVNAVVDLFGVLWNIVADFINFFGNVFNDPIGAIVHLFFDLVDTVLSLLQTLAKVIDTIFGTNLAKGVQGWRDGLSGWVDDKFGKEKEFATKWDHENSVMERWDYGDAWDSGMKFGNNVSDKLTSGVNGLMNSLGGLNDQMEDMLGNPEDMDKYGMGNMEDFIDPNGNMPVDVKKNSDKEVDISDEDLQMLRDIANRDYMLNYKQITPNVNIKFGDVRETADVNGIKDELERMMEEELAELYVVEEG